MTTVNKVIVRTTRKNRRGKTVVYDLHNQEIKPPCEDSQILAALKQQYDVLSFVTEDGVATAKVQKLPE
jgi:hypothetical protein